MLSTKATSKHNKVSPAAGRPRAFVPEVALLSALDVFWHKGYQATSLDDLTTAMQLSRSSFYACFGSKHAVLLAAVHRYADNFYAAICEVVATEPEPRRAFETIMTRIVDVHGGLHGCFFLNSVTELAPHDPQLADYSRGHIERITALLAGLIGRLGFTPTLAAERAAAALALAMGAITLRKAGVAAAQVQAVLDQHPLLLARHAPMQAL
jgi:TetR/AcrR family transcriptional repressor of nem operon